MAGSGRGGGENHRRRGIEELAPVVFADAKHIEAHLVSERDCFEQLAEMSRRDRLPDRPRQRLPLRNYLRRSPFVGDSCSSCNALLEKTGESGADAQEHNDPQHRHDESQRQTARKHQYVNEQNVDDDRSEQRQREWDVAIDQEQDRRNDLEQKYRDQIMGDKKRPDELAGRSGRRRAGNEVEEAVQSEDEKDEAKKETGDDSGCFHVKIV